MIFTGCIHLGGGSSSGGGAAGGAGNSTLQSPDFYYVIPLAGQSNAMSYGEGIPLPDTLDAPHPRIKQMARRSTVTPGGEACSYNDIIPADHCLHDVQDMSIYSHPRADLAKGQYGCVGQGLHIARKLLAYIPDNAGILLVPCCRGGSAFTRGAEGTFNPASGASADAARWGVGKPLYQDLLTRTRAAMEKNPKNVLLAVCWMQGEFDMSGSAYAQQPELFAGMVRQFRSDLASYVSQMPGFRVENVPWICGDTTHYWKQNYPSRYEAVYGAYGKCREPDVYFVPFMTDESGAHTATNDPLDDPDIPAAAYFGAASRTSANWTTAARSSHFSSWARRGIIPERMASAILFHAGKISQIAAGGGTSGVGGLKRYAPAVTEAGYNGRRGDGSLTSQGWTLSDAVETIRNHPDGQGGHVVSIAKSSSTAPWKVGQAAVSGGDLIRYGGRLTCRFRITTSAVTSGKYAFGFYWCIPVADIPSGVTLANRNLADAKPFVMSCAVTTDNRSMVLSNHAATLAQIGTLGTISNEWHTLELHYPGGNSATVTPVFDGVSLTPFQMTYSKALAEENTLIVTGITKGETYDVEFSAFSVCVNRDDGVVTLSREDASGYVYFPETCTGRVIIPDVAITSGNTIEIVTSGGGVTVEPENTNVLVKAPGQNEALPSSFVLPSGGVLVQTGGNGKTWEVTSGTVTRTSGADEYRVVEEADE